jgi:hypothetical protein
VRSLERVDDYLAAGGSDTIDCYAIVQPRGDAEPIIFVEQGSYRKYRRVKSD